ncbi:hypothetical protein UAY_00920 [Enterococcus moraviensis ATCC BAA-383]|uniref:N-acetyltransferase domain-containing protein n=1 Tax=Enterococcus moraviensis ATCC BAA-383 TaxID=1158609 RepID=R2T5B8_9ENTE|nr:GNAT family N-acetyltransferase [Enterococcus moraviensis]EOI02673.1 hypothetical protein UAY_00920 [Enterococcus moraviensis ATCC BAA-383]EOT73950.1 hypothetical protein I586_00946 [Enterococcus moraviensis ATCC BAA-383]OJG66136.1 hypothetical protein RV09_GL000985 [Enterococcus moraviensis]
MEKITIITKEIKELLSQATARNKVDDELKKYLDYNDWILYLHYDKTILVGCIGIQMLENNRIEIKHIATKKAYRHKRIGSNMIDYIVKTYAPSKIFAETDKDAVGFYKKSDFTINSLGEKYPGVERFSCLK